MINEILSKSAILRIGEVSGIDGRKVYITVDKNKNSSDLLFDGKIIKNISVGSYIEIQKGFQSIIAKVDGEKLEKETLRQKIEKDSRYEIIDKNKRTLTVSLIGYIEYDGGYKGGIKELPLIGNEAYILTEEKIHKIHNLIKDKSPLYINIAKTDIEEIDIDLPIDGIFNSHIAIFGNTGSGKSNTLASLYQEMYKVMSKQNGDKFKGNCRFLLFDFNGEYSGADCITNNKKVYNLSTIEKNGKDKVPIKQGDFLNIEIFSILANATEKTQKPFIRRSISFYKNIHESDDPLQYFRNILKKRIVDVLKMSDKNKAYLLVDYIKSILPEEINANGEVSDITDDIEWHNVSCEFILKNGGVFLSQNPESIQNTKIYQKAESFEFFPDVLSNVIMFLYLQLIGDVLSNRAVNEHIRPAINKLIGKKGDIIKTHEIAQDDKDDIWVKCQSNFIIINLHDVNLDMKKTIPLLIAKKFYNEHKKEENKKTLNIIVDEAHNILSKESFRETEEWKDYRLETFEEIIKEGRKFGVFMTIASQRPNDISETIISQAHNYFIHQLINHKDLLTISNAVSYIDKITEESIPTLPVGTCIFSGIATPMPLKLKVNELLDKNKPQSKTLEFSNLVLENDSAEG